MGLHTNSMVWATADPLSPLLLLIHCVPALSPALITLPTTQGSSLGQCLLHWHKFMFLTQTCPKNQ